MGYNRINIFIYYLFFVFVRLVVGSRNPMRIPDKSTNKHTKQRMNKGIFKKYKFRYDRGWQEVRDILLPLTSFHVPLCSMWFHMVGYQYPPCTGRLLICLLSVNRRTYGL